jgi:integrase
MEALRKQQGIAARVLEFTILTACRTGETRGATWNEVDLPNETWTIPAERMKKGDREHQVPLSEAESQNRDEDLVYYALSLQWSPFKIWCDNHRRIRYVLLICKNCLKLFKVTQDRGKDGCIAAGTSSQYCLN